MVAKIGITMVDNLREDLTAYDELAEIFDIEDVPFEKVMATVTGFVSSVLATESEAVKLGISPDVLKFVSDLMSQSKSFFDGKMSAGELEKYRVDAWNKYDALAQDVNAQRLMRIVVLCLYDKEAAEYDTFGSAAMYESYLSCLNDLAPRYCKLFVSYVRANMGISF